ncbi:MAG: ABC transporter permease [Coprobacter sp.]|nr:ABC transporter permease [Coprobacter sp.]
METNDSKSGLALLRQVMLRELHRLVSRPLYLLCMVAAPLFSALFLLTLMKNGLPERLPAAVVDLDRSPASRNFIRQLNSLSLVEVVSQPDDFAEARAAMQRGEIYGFLVIPESFEAKATAGRRPEISFYTHNAYYIPGALLYKGFKTMSVLASGAIVQQTLLAHGAYAHEITPRLQPVVADVHALNNPWLNYSVYLNNTFIPGMLQLLILLVTVFSIGTELKQATSREWLAASHHSVVLALAGKLLPQTVIFFAVGVLCQSLLYGYWHFPLQNGLWPMLAAMLLLVVASQSYAVLMISIAPSLRIGLSMAGLFGIMSISLTGFSVPVPAMYAPFRLFSHIFPLRHYFLIYADQALNGIPLYYSRWHYLALLLFALVSLPLLPRLKNALRREVYIP